MKHIGLFEGIGGFSLAARWMGWETIAWCEWNEFCQKVLSYHFPNAKKHGDITKTDFSIYRGKCDIVTGGFPCQPYSAAGKRKGKEDDRHLWPQMLRAIKEIQPRWIVGENVSGLLNWNRGMVLDEIKADLEAAGFEVLPPLVLPACAVNAPHRRDRVWIVAHSNSNRQSISTVNGKEGCGKLGVITDTESSESGQPTKRKGRQNITGGIKNNDGDKRKGQITSDPDISIGCEGGLHPAKQKKTERYAGSFNALSYQRPTWDNFPTQPPIRGRNDGFPGMLDSETIFKELGVEHPRKPAIGYSKWRNESIKAYGNSVVPQIIFEIFKAIEQINTQYGN